MRSLRDRTTSSRARRAKSSFTTRTSCWRTATAGKRKSPPTCRRTRRTAECGSREGNGMIVQAIAFYVFAAVAIVSAVLVVANRNPVYSVLFLILTFFNAAGLFVLLGAEFLAMMLVVVYVGAVAVLFLFVVMMLDINFAELRQGFVRYAWIGAIVGVILVAEIVFF